jgi:hypothetical protein
MSNLKTQTQSVAEFEAEGSKKAAQVDKKEKEKEKAEEDQQFVIDGAILECKSCVVPIGKLKVNFDTPTIQNKKTATVKEKSALSLQFSGNCLKSPKAELPCKGVMKLGQWQDVGTSLVQNQKPLIKKSTIMCNYGGSKIKFIKSGQINVPSNIEPIVKNNKEILSAVWVNNETREEIKEANMNDEVNILVKTKNYKEGEVIFLDITEKEGGEVKNGKTLITVSGIVKSDGSAELKKSYTI